MEGVCRGDACECLVGMIRFGLKFKGSSVAVKSGLQ